MIRIILFCTASLLASVGGAFLLYPYASLPQEVVVANRSAQPMEAFDQVIDAGEFGPMTVIELMAFYLENPPKPEGAGGRSAAPERQFGGC